MDIVSKDKTYSDYYSKPKISRNRLTKYEFTKLLGIRIQQLVSGSPSLIDTTNIFDVKEIALEEIKQKRLPLLIRRRLPNGSVEDWRLEDLEFDLEKFI